MRKNGRCFWGYQPLRYLKAPEGLNVEIEPLARVLSQGLSQKWPRGRVAAMSTEKIDRTLESEDVEDRDSAD